MRRSDLNHQNTRARSSSRDDSIMPYVAALIISAALSLPLALALVGSPLTQGVSFAACLVCGALAVYTSRRFSSVIIVGLILTFVLSYLKDPTSAAIIIGAVLLSGVFSAAVAAARGIKILFVVLSPIVAFSASFALTGSIAAFAAPCLRHSKLFPRRGIHTLMACAIAVPRIRIT